MLCLVKGDFKGQRPLAIKLGGYPEDPRKFAHFVRLIKQNKEAITFKSLLALAEDKKGGQLEKAPKGGKASADDKIAELIEIGNEDPSELFDAKTLFKHFANSKGRMGFEEFNNVFV